MYENIRCSINSIGICLFLKFEVDHVIEGTSREKFVKTIVMNVLDEYRKERESQIRKEMSKYDMNPSVLNNIEGQLIWNKPEILEEVARRMISKFVDTENVNICSVRVYSFENVELRKYKTGNNRFSDYSIEMMA